jgi:hypothetical protein
MKQFYWAFRIEKDGKPRKADPVKVFSRDLPAGTLYRVFLPASADETPVAALDRVVKWPYWAEDAKDVTNVLPEKKKMVAEPAFAMFDMGKFGEGSKQWQ